MSVTSNFNSLGPYISSSINSSEKVLPWILLLNHYFNLSLAVTHNELGQIVIHFVYLIDKTSFQELGLI